MRLIPLFTCAAVSLVTAILPLTATAHEVWIAPHAYQIKPGEQVKADLKNGQNFKGFDLSWFQTRIIRSDWSLNGQMTKITGRAGDVPALVFTPQDDGLVQIVHQSTMETLRYAEWEKFYDFASHKDQAFAIARHQERGLPEIGFDEGYTRFTKSLIGVGSAEGADHVAGLEIELVALANPYTDPLPDGLPVQVIYQAAPRADAQIEVFEQAPDGAVTVFTRRTDATGTALVPVQAGHIYLVDSVVLREPSVDLAQAKGIVWESLWASLTFLRP